MAFYWQPIVGLEHAPRQRDAQPQAGDSEQNVESETFAQHMIGVPKEVLKFAPKKIRLAQTAEERINQLETEIKQWQERAGEAETRLLYIEKTIQQIAADHVHGFKKNRPAA